MARCPNNYRLRWEAQCVANRLMSLFAKEALVKLACWALWFKCPLHIAKSAWQWGQVRMSDNNSKVASNVKKKKKNTVKHLKLWNNSEVLLLPHCSIMIARLPHHTASGTCPLARKLLAAKPKLGSMPELHPHDVCNGAPNKCHNLHFLTNRSRLKWTFKFTS